MCIALSSSIVRFDSIAPAVVGRFIALHIVVRFIAPVIICGSSYSASYCGRIYLYHTPYSVAYCCKGHYYLRIKYLMLILYYPPVSLLTYCSWI